MAKKKALGDAFDSIFDDDLFGGESAGGESGLKYLKVGELEPNRDQPRREFDQAKLEELAESITQHGIIQPITVRELESGVKQIIAGERRWRAARIAGLEEVPVRIMELTDVQAMQIALIENLQREDLNPIEEAAGYRELIDGYKMTQEQLAKTMGKPRSTIANSLRLLALPDEMLEAVKGGKLSKGHCKAIMSLTSSKTMVKLANRVIEEGLSVRETERLAKDVQSEAQPKTKSARLVNTYYREAELALGQAFGTRVRIVDGSKKKTLCIEFADEEQLKGIIGKF